MPHAVLILRPHDRFTEGRHRCTYNFIVSRLSSFPRQKEKRGSLPAIWTVRGSAPSVSLISISCLRLPLLAMQLPSHFLCHSYWTISLSLLSFPAGVSVKHSARGRKEKRAMNDGGRKKRRKKISVSSLSNPFPLPTSSSFPHSMSWRRSSGRRSERRTGSCWSQAASRICSLQLQHKHKHQRVGSRGAQHLQYGSAAVVVSFPSSLSFSCCTSCLVVLVRCEPQTEARIMFCP